MSHQNMDDLLTPVAALKEVLAPIHEAGTENVARHGNAWLSNLGVAITALLTFGWNQQKTLNDRFKDARAAARRSLASSCFLAASYQALMVALRACGDELHDKVSAQLVARLQQSDKWLTYGRPTFAVDGSKFAVPRTKQNLAAFAATSRKSKAAYHKEADYQKAKTTQLHVSLCMHLGTGFPAFWNLGGSADSERGLLLDMLDRLPPHSRLVLDAYYTGYEFWKQLGNNSITFVVRAGSNVELLSELKKLGKVKCKGETVLYWPKSARDAGGEPIVLKLVTGMVGRKKMFLLTNELTLSDDQIVSLYKQRWGVEVFFRTIKQSFERAKLLSRTPENVKLELQWTLLGIWLAMTEGANSIPEDSRLSPIQVLRTFCNLVLDIARQSPLKLNLRELLSNCVIADESNRTSSKNSDDYPRKKKKNSAGDPTLIPISDDLAKLAIETLA